MKRQFGGILMRLSVLLGTKDERKCQKQGNAKVKEKMHSGWKVSLQVCINIVSSPEPYFTLMEYLLVFLDVHQC